MSDYVAVDMKPVNIGGDVLLLGVAVDVKDHKQFCEYYFSKSREFCEENGISKPYPVLKSSEIKQAVPSYDLSEKLQGFFDSIVANPHIDNIHVSIGWYNGSFSPDYSSQEMSATDVINKHLKPHFEILTLWQYHKHHSEEKPSPHMPNIAYCDDTGGKVTKAWKYCGKQFDDISVVPHGDRTYPAISTADLIVGSLGDYLPEDIPFQDAKRVSKEFLIDKLDGDVFSIFSEINEEMEHADHITPQLRYPIKGHIHYPHPVVYIYDDLFEENSNLFSMAAEIAHSERGCTKNISQPEFPNSVEEGDYIVYSKDDTELMRSIKSSFPQINANTLSIDAFSELYEERIRE